MLIGKGRLLYDGALRKLRERYDRVRRLEINFDESPSGPSLPAASAALPVVLPEPTGTKLVSQKEGHGIYEVDTGLISIAEALRLVGERLAITDMSAGSRPIEEIIASFYKEGNL
jgi:ABC-2 type transport system ATP-binding protein